MTDRTWTEPNRTELSDWSNRTEPISGLKNLSWRSRWIILLCTLERGMPVSPEISRVERCVLACTPNWAGGPQLLNVLGVMCRTRSAAAWLPGNFVDAFKFPTLVRKHFQQPSRTILLWQMEIFLSELQLPVKFPWFYLILLILRPREFPKVK